jgi:hypothetical protein
MRRRLILLVSALVLAAAAAVSGYLLIDSAKGKEAETPLEVLNRKIAANGLPTLASEAELTWTPPTPHDSSTATPGPSPTPTLPDCAAGTISGAEAIVAQYGSASRCGSVGRFLYFSVSGWYDSPLVDDQGGIAVYACADEDPCNRGDPVVRPVVWAFYPAPAKGRFKVGGFVPPDTLIIMGMGQICFNLRTGEYITKQPCVIEPTVPPGPPWPVTPYLEPTAFDPGTPPCVC